MKKQKFVPRMITISEAAKITKLSCYFIRKLAIEGEKIKVIKNGKKYYINFDSLIDYLNNGDTNTIQYVSSSKIKRIEV